MVWIPQKQRKETGVMYKAETDKGVYTIMSECTSRVYLIVLKLNDKNIFNRVFVSVPEAMDFAFWYNTRGRMY